jgi:hypothetical protein
MHQGYVSSKLLECGKLHLHAAVLEVTGVTSGMLFLDLGAPSPPCTGHVDEISIGRETRSEPVHVVRVPRRLDLVHQRCDLSLLHNQHDTAPLGMATSTCSGSGVTPELGAA